MWKINRFKLILAKIKIAQLHSKKTLKLKLFSIDLLLLNVLWKNGFIYGYKKEKNTYFIFLKYSKGHSLINNIIFSNTKVSANYLNNLLKIDPYQSYFMFTSEGIFFYSLKRLIPAKGGIIFAKL